MKANQTKVKKKGRTVRAFKRDLSLWLFCVPGVVLTFIFSYIPMYGIRWPSGGTMRKPVSWEVRG